MLLEGCVVEQGALVGMGAAFAKDDLRGFPVEVASTTLAGCFP